MSNELPANSQGKMIVFGAKQIRRTWHEEQWFFSVVDIIAALTDSDNPRDYWYRMKQREKESSGIELSTFCRQLKLTSSDGKTYKTDCVNTEAAFRIIQSVPSPKAEPFKRWLAQVGREKASSGVDLSIFCRKVPLRGADGKTYKSDAVNNHGGFGRWAFIVVDDLIRC